MLDLEYYEFIIINIYSLFTFLFKKAVVITLLAKDFYLPQASLLETEQLNGNKCKILF